MCLKNLLRAAGRSYRPPPAPPPLPPAPLEPAPAPLPVPVPVPTPLVPVPVPVPVLVPVPIPVFVPVPVRVPVSVPVLRSMPALSLVIVPPELVAPPLDMRPDARSLGFPVVIRSLVIVPLSMRVLVVRLSGSSVVRVSHPITPTAITAAADKMPSLFIADPCKKTGACAPSSNSGRSPPQSQDQLGQNGQFP